MKNTLTLSIVSHGHGAMLTQLLSELSQQKTLSDVKIIITLNIPGERLDVIDTLPLNLVIVQNDFPKGFGENHNNAFRLCDTPWFGVLNPDLLLCPGDPEPFGAMLHGMQNSANGVGLIAPEIIDEASQIEDSVRGNLTPSSLVARHLFGKKKTSSLSSAHKGVDFFWLAGMCLLISSDAFESINGFDERFFLYCEDYDLCARLFNAGYSIEINQTVRVIHKAQRDSHKSIRHLTWHLKSLLLVWRSAAFWLILIYQLKCFFKNRIINA